MRPEDARARLSSTGEALSLDVPGGGSAIALQFDAKELVDRWYQARSTFSKANYWPLAVCCWNTPSSWSKQVLDQDLFSRSEFADEFKAGGDISPAALVKRSSRVNLDAEIARWSTRLERAHAGELEELIDCELEGTARQFGSAPTMAAVLAARPDGVQAVERYLLDWELARFGDAALVSTWGQDIEWFVPDSDQANSLLLLPTPDGWGAPAYVHWYGARAVGSPAVVALLRRWHVRFEAELACHWGTMLQFVVSRPPTDIDAAWNLAREQALVAPWTTMGPALSIRDLARALLHADRWFLHQRP